MAIIDAHMHLAGCRVFDMTVSEQEILDGMDANGVDATIVQPFPGADSPRQVHDRIAALAGSHPGRFYGIASINPHQDSQRYFAELSRCVKQLGFVGVKLHTLGHGVHPASADGTTVFEAAEQLGIPVMVHTGPGAPFAAPTSVAPQLKRFPGVRVVLAHAGHGLFSGEAIAVADMFPQVTLEPSWCPFYIIGGMIATLGARRVMLGCDLPPNVRMMLGSIRALALSVDDEAMVLGGTAQEVFELHG